MNYRQLAEWLAKGYGQIQDPYENVFYTQLEYPSFADNEFVYQGYLIRSWGSSEWTEPTNNIYERDCKTNSKKEK